MDIRIPPSRLSGAIAAISSKSDAHRNLICAALAQSPTVISLNTLSDDIMATIDCIIELGAEVIIEDGKSITVSGIDSHKSNPQSGYPSFLHLNCRESGSTLRFLLPVASALYDDVSFEGSGRLPERPLSPLIEEMEAHGCKFSAHRLPFSVGGPLNGGTFSLPGNISSQYISGLLMAFPLTGKDCRIILTSQLESAGYIDMTIDTMQRYGINVQRHDNGFSVAGGQHYVSPGAVTIDGDWSNSAFWLTAGTLSGPIICSGLSMGSLQGDKQILSVLKRMGANIRHTQNGEILSGPTDAAALTSVEIDASQVPDLVPILAVASATADGETIIYNAARLRLKESDRLQAICDCINRIGGKAVPLNDGIRITGVESLSGGTVDSYGDHRIVMAIAIASTVCTGDIIIRGAEAVNKSYPEFMRDFEKLGGRAYVVSDRQ